MSLWQDIRPKGLVGSKALCECYKSARYTPKAGFAVHSGEERKKRKKNSQTTRDKKQKTRLLLKEEQSWQFNCKYLPSPIFSTQQVSSLRMRGKTKRPKLSQKP